jgi:deoxyribodipyrimidine photo-lyase
LIDADVAANNGNWQWCASTGTDAMPKYRIFNPVLQSKKFDPDGDYIRRFIPELGRIPGRLIHQPQHMTIDDQERFACRIGSDYPAQIVDHQAASRRYLQQTS